ncbi:UNVERIFIED_CONTAM: Histone deacetylase 3 [Siphonaria sp. JEL0065]|nr:Histone deacetylase 3 [Siphonaria sp. JEL0065]
MLELMIVLLLKGSMTFADYLLEVLLKEPEKGRGFCVAFMKKFKVPLMVLGGGGYTIRNVARAWTYETGVCTGTELPNELPRTKNANTRQYLDRIRLAIAENLRQVNWAPSVAMNEIPPDLDGFNQDTGSWEVDDNEDKNPEFRVDQNRYGLGAAQRLRREKELNEFDDREMYDGDQDQDH